MTLVFLQQFVVVGCNPLDIFSRDVDLAERAVIVIDQPALNAICMVVVSYITGKRRDHAIFGKVGQADRALLLAVELSGVPLSSHQARHQILSRVDMPVVFPAVLIYYEEQTWGADDTHTGEEEQYQSWKNTKDHNHFIVEFDHALVCGAIT